MQSIALPFEQFLLWQHITPSDLLNNTALRTAPALGGGGGWHFDTFFSQGFNFIQKKKVAFYEDMTFQPRLHLDAGLMGQRPSPNP